MSERKGEGWSGGLFKPMNLLDRAIAYVAPALGLERARARAMTAVMGNYFAGSYSRRAMLNFRPRANSADADLNPDLATMRGRSRDLERNSPLARGAVNTTVTRVVGTGLALQPAIDAEFLGLTPEAKAEKEAEILREFRLWAEDPRACDITGAQDFYEQQDLALRSTLVNGDLFVNLPYVRKPGNVYGLKVQMIEADRCSNPNGGPDTRALSAGVKRDEYGAAVAYFISARHPGDNVRDRETTRWDEYPAFTPKGRYAMLHLFERRRPNQSRGEPWLAPVIEPLKQLERYSEAEITAAVVSSMFTVFWKTSSDEGGLPSDSTAGAAAPATPGANGDNVKLGHGAIIDIGPEDEVSFADPSRPNANFDPFVQAVLRQIGVALELPFEVLIKHFTSSYTAARAAILDAWNFFRKRRDWLAKRFCRPIYCTWMDEAVASGRIAAPGYFADPLTRLAYLGAEWVGDGMGAIDPLKEVNAAEKRLQLSLTTLAKETMLHDGGDWKANLRQRGVEEAERRALGLVPAPAPATAAGPDKPPTEPGDDETTTPAKPGEE